MKQMLNPSYLGHALFITFSCYKNRRLLNRDQCKKLLVEELAGTLAKHQGLCLGFVVMPDHAHDLLCLAHPEQLPALMQRWKRLSSFRIKKHLLDSAPDYFSTDFRDDPVWKHRYYCFPVAGEEKAREKLAYMHQNPVKAGLVERPEEWAYSSARHYLCGQAVGVKIEWPS